MSYLMESVLSELISCHSWRIRFSLVRVGSSMAVDTKSKISCTGYLMTYTYIHTNKFLMRPPCQFASQSGALRWHQKQLWVARFKQFSFKLVLKCQKRISWTGVDTKRVPDCRSGCTKRSLTANDLVADCCCRRRAEVERRVLDGW